MRRYLAILFLGLAVVPFAWTGLAPAKSTAPQSRQVGCGVERWSVKTLADPMGRMLSLQPRLATVRALRRKQAPAYLSLRRIHGIEQTTYRVQASLVEMKLEDDSDIHLVIADPRSSGQTMIAEFPAATCTARATPKARTKMRQARSALVAACGAPSGSFKSLSGTATITAVAFSGAACHGPPAPPPPPPAGPPQPSGSCAASYPDFCIAPPPPDLDCAEVPGTNFRVRWDVPDPDPHHVDGDRDGVGCES